MKIKIKKIHPNAIIPSRHSGGWFDLYTCEPTFIDKPSNITYKNETKKIKSGPTTYYQSKYINLGIAVQLPKGFEAKILPRSSTFNRFNIIQSNSQGVIENSYCGEGDVWKYPVINLFHDSIIIPEGTRLAQFKIELNMDATIWQKIKWMFSRKIEIMEVKKLTNKNRGGFGSTGDK